MAEIGNFYDSYRRSKREREAALVMLAEAKQWEAGKEQLVAEGKLRKVIEYDKQQRLTKVRYEPA